MLTPKSEPHTLTDPAQLRAILQGVSDVALIVLRPDQKVAFQNDAAEALLSSQEGWLWRARFLAAEDRRHLKGAESPAHQLSIARVPGPIAVIWKKPNGAECILNFTAKILPLGDLCLLRIEDQTKLWAMRAQVAQATKIDDVDQVTWEAVHEMANIFGIVQISAEAAEMEDPSPPMSRHLDSILQACRRGRDLTHSLLDMTHDAAVRPDSVDSGEVFASIASLVRRVMPSFITINVTTSKEQAWVQCTRTDLETSLLNLLTHARNAIIDTNQGQGQIDFVLSVVDGAAVFVVENDGVAAPADLMERLRAPLKVDAQDEDVSDIGLRLVDTVARRAQGSFEISARGKGGTRAVLSLPVQTNDAGTENWEADPASSDLTGYHITLVEKNAMLRGGLADAMRRAGATVFDTALGQEAMNWFDTAKPQDVIITNTVLSDGVACEALGRRALQSHPEARVIVLSGARDTQRVKSMTLPCLVLGKPVRMRELEYAIRLFPPGTVRAD